MPAPAVLVFLAVALVGTLAQAQRTWIVDAANGAGTDFTDLPPALAAAADGDTILIRTGIYATGKTTKGLRLIGRGTPVLRSLEPDGGLHLRDLPTGSSFVMQGLRLERLARDPRTRPTASMLQFENCRGRIHLADLRITDEYSGFDAVYMWHCAAVTMLGCTLQPGVTAWNTRLSSTGCSIRGADQDPNWPTKGPTNAASVGNSLIEFNQCHVTGGSMGSSGPLLYAVVAYASTLVVRGDASARIEGGMNGRWSSSVIIDPAVTWNGPTANVVWILPQQLPALVAAGGSSGGSLGIDLKSTPSSPFLLVAGWPVVPVLDPQHGERWMDAPVLLLAAGVQDPSGHWRASWPIPADPRLVGTSLALQGIDTSATTLGISNAAVVVIH